MNNFVVKFFEIINFSVFRKKLIYEKLLKNYQISSTYKNWGETFPFKKYVNKNSQVKNYIKKNKSYKYYFYHSFILVLIFKNI